MEVLLGEVSEILRNVKDCLDGISHALRTTLKGLLLR